MTFLVLPSGQSISLDGEMMRVGRIPFDPRHHHHIASVTKERPRVEGDTLLLPDLYVSKRHAILTPNAAGGYEIEDAGSKAGTFINNVQITTGARLNDGDRLLLGETTIIYCDRDIYAGDLQPDFDAEDWERFGSD